MNAPKRFKTIVPYTEPVPKWGRAIDKFVEAKGKTLPSLAELAQYIDKTNLTIVMCLNCIHPAERHTLGYDADRCQCGCRSRNFETWSIKQLYEHEQRIQSIATHTNTQRKCAHCGGPAEYWNGRDMCSGCYSYNRNDI